MRFCVQWKSVCPLLRTMETPISVTAYNWIPNENPHPIHCFDEQATSFSATHICLAASDCPQECDVVLSYASIPRCIRLPALPTIPKILGSPPATAKNSNQKTFLRTMEIPFSVFAYNGNPYIRTAYNGNPSICIAYNGNPYIPFCVQWKSLSVLRTMMYNGNPCIRYCVQ